MKRILVFLFSCLTTISTITSQIINKEPLSVRQTGYKIDTKLDPFTKTVSGTLEAFWVNKSKDVVPDIQLHLYMNAFKSKNTTLYKESGGLLGYKDSDNGWIDIKSFTDRNGTDLIPGIRPFTGGGILLLFILSQLLFFIKVMLKAWRYGSVTSLMEQNFYSPTPLKGG